MKKLSLLWAVVIVSWLITVSEPRVVKADPVTAGTVTLVVVNQILGDLKQLMASAENTGNLLIMQAAAQAYGVIDQWKKTNEAILDKALKDIDSVMLEQFERARVLTKLLLDGTGELQQNVADMLDVAGDIASRLPSGDRTPAISRFMPRVVPPTASETFELRLRGRRFDVATAVLILPNGKRIPGRTVSPLEIQFTVPSSAIPSDATKILLFDLPVEFMIAASVLEAAPASTPIPPSLENENGFLSITDDDILKPAPPKDPTIPPPQMTAGGDYVKTMRILTIARLPRRAGSVAIRTILRNETRESRTFLRELGEFSGKDERVSKLAVPPPVDPNEVPWRWDMQKPFSPIQGGGEAARFECIDMNSSTPYGIFVIARCDKIINMRTPFGGSGYVSIALEGTIIRDIVGTQSGPALDAEITWTEDVKFPLSLNFKSMEIEINGFDHQRRNFTASGANGVFTIVKSNESVIVTAQAPKDYLELPATGYELREKAYQEEYHKRLKAEFSKLPVIRLNDIKEALIFEKSKLTNPGRGDNTEHPFYDLIEALIVEKSKGRL